MGAVQFKKANCKNCYKCIRSCPVNAIAFRNDQAEIVHEECMLCGNCLTACPQNAKVVNSDLDKVKAFIQKKEKVYVSLAPSFISAFEKDEHWLVFALKKLGFTHIEGTSKGAYQVSRQYEKLIQEGKMKNIITSACSSIIMLIEKHYPELIDQLAPVVSPMIAHAKMLRETYGERIKVVFIGPCLSKKEECNDLQNEGQIDAVLTFEELYDWLEEENLFELIDEDEVLKNFDTTERIYPVPGGILNTLDKNIRKAYRNMSIDGIERCMTILDSIKEGGFENYLIEMSSCTGSCIGSHCTKETKGGYLAKRERIIDYAKRMNTVSNIDSIRTVMEDTKLDFSKKFYNKSKCMEIPSEAVIQGILNSIGKFSKDKELNCGACGYKTCRDKAIAVNNGRAQVYMCLPYMRERAESISNIIINHTPYAIFAVDMSLKIQELNKPAQKMFMLEHRNMEGANILDLLPCEDFQKVLSTSENIYEEKFYYEAFDMTVKQSIIYIPEHNTLVIIINDITEQETMRQKIKEKQTQNTLLAQKVIEKQMTVAQEIASLLGETTAETKVVLTKLKKSIMLEMGE